MAALGTAVGRRMGARHPLGRGIRDSVEAVLQARLGSVLARMARTLDASADLAGQHAERHHKAGRAEAAAYERRVAARARGAAQHARTRAEGLPASGRAAAG